MNPIIQSFYRASLRRWFGVISVSMLAMVMVGCSGGANAPHGAPPSGLWYEQDSAIYTVGQAIKPNGPTYSGDTLTSFQIEPSLPAGLSMDPGTGIISGTPSSPSAATVYAVTGSNATHSLTTSLSIAVESSEIAPGTFTYREANVVYAVNKTIAPNEPIGNTGGVITGYGVSPSLPVGLQLDPNTGVISGTPTKVTPTTTYTVTGSNGAGRATTQVVIEVAQMEVPPVQITYAEPNAVYVRGIPIVANVPETQGGEIADWNVSPPLPDGLSMNEKTGVISGQPTTIQDPTEYTITGRNEAGTGQATITITVSEQLIAPEFQRVTVTNWLNCTSLDGPDGAVLVQIPDLSSYLRPGDLVKLTWTVAGGRVGSPGPIVEAATLVKDVPFGSPDFPATEFIWRVTPYSERGLPLALAYGSGFATFSYEFQIGQQTFSASAQKNYEPVRGGGSPCYPKNP
ncbi:Ig domain-containing protein [Burkholderia ubonensis]|uniref:Ig domain-containing protein n=1 Tax=Burkholderia ubonensis TaxID=101571 RepID=UPI0009B46B9C|nr:Ig domain-containing protein [Burkholderia ubonensis]